MSTPFVSDGNYKLTAAVEAIYYSDGTHYRTTMYSLSHDSSVTPGYLGYTLQWKGSGVFRITLVGKATFSATGISDGTVDCSTNQILETTLDTDGNVTDTTPIQTGCGGTSISLTIVSEKQCKNRTFWRTPVILMTCEFTLSSDHHDHYFPQKLWKFGDF